jgi:hypothetical protein
MLSSNLAELPENEEREADDERKFRERRAFEILTRYQKTTSHEATVHSAIQDGVRETTRVKEWNFNVWFALNKARAKCHLNNVSTIVTALTARNPSYGVQFDSMLDSFLFEMDKQNRLGTPDDYDEEWGTDAAERRERERVATYVRSAVRFAEATI